MKFRCSRCQTRHTFDSENLHRYLIVKVKFPHRRCKKCGHTSFYQVNEKTCHCDAYHFPHRRGSGNCTLQ